MSTATIRDVAKHAGVGVGTVSRVLNENPDVSDATRQKVLAAIAELNFSPSLVARRLSLRKTSTIGIIAPFFTRPAFVERLRGVEKVIAQSNYDLVLFNVETPERRDTLFRDVPRPDRVDGLLIISLSPDDAAAERFRNAKVPTILIDAYHPDLNCVIIDNIAGGQKAVEHLISLGHQRIAFISDAMDNPYNPFRFSHIHDRYQGYRQALTQANIPFRPQYHKQGVHSRRTARQLAYELLTQPDPPTAIFAYSDTQAFGSLEAAQDLGLSIPRDLSIIGFDDIELAEYLNLTTIRQNLVASGEIGANQLLQILTDTSPTLTQKITLPIELILRQTTAPPLNAPPA
ncbi:MAG: LacI family DNA-binding transcriptional regulator [Chloroflexi bacterium]|nr:LacI family DNA-binding transcriptional regulator [Chloroflexota bacterium]MBP8056146.1 LacI family DNA-binding transcriptional regulator [Chloroflexota bacterium]